MAFDMSDYVEVADRIRAWYEQHPTARITTEIRDYTDSRVVVKASAWRGDETDVYGPAGVGHSSLGIPGTTPYTKGSELENAETSAVGRALVMAGIPSKNVASANEVRGKNPAASNPRTQESKPAVPTRENEGAADAGGGGGGLGEGAKPPASCTHPDIVLTKPDGSPLPKGYWRCPACGTTGRDAA